MNDANRSAAIAPQISGPIRPNYVGAAALGVAVVSAGGVIATVAMLQEHAKYVNGLPPGGLSGGIGFSVNFYPLLIATFALVLGASATLLLVASFFITRSERRNLLSGLHLGAATFLLPFLYLVFLSVSHLFQRIG